MYRIKLITWVWTTNIHLRNNIDNPLIFTLSTYFKSGIFLNITTGYIACFKKRLLAGTLPKLSGDVFMSNVCQSVSLFVNVEKFSLEG